MLRKIVDMPIGEARYIVLKSLDTHDEIGELILQSHPDAMVVVNEIIGNVLAASLRGGGGVSAFEFQDRNYIHTFIAMTKELPSYMLLDINCVAWDSFLNGWLIIGDQYQELLDKAIDCCGQDTAEIKEYTKLSYELRNALDGVVRLIEIGNGYIDLLQATSHLLREMQTWGDARPTSIKMSEAYLQALDFYKKD